MENRLRPGYLYIQRRARLELMLPVQRETQIINVEGQCRLNRHYPQHRDTGADSRRSGPLRSPDQGGEHVPFLYADLMGNNLKCEAVRDIESRCGKFLTEEFGKRLDAACIDGRHRVSLPRGPSCRCSHCRL